MRAVRFERDGTVKFVQVPNPQPGPEDVLVQVLAAGVCHTDLHLLDEVKAGNHDPLIPGHEIAGRIAKVGSDVYGSNVGDRVVVHFEQPCGTCRQCKRMRTNLCENGTTLGFDAPGGYAEFVVAKQTTVLPVPPNLEPALAAPLGCSGATAHRSVVALGQAGEGDLVVVLGAGGVGLSAIQIEKVHGTRVLAGDEGADVSIDFVGTKATFDLGRSVLGSGGRFVAVAPGSEAVSVTADDLI